ncbi:hypothetical protein BBK36DRAFT_1167984 [Trichoderma citrinoviride]|uniref:Allergen Asp f 4 n=1 Tax=Trichoderma citrinoviride TaxID=58853 RepID=A0A2T4BE58_9HYPO|nr:hypothetical protein BBK36DRAFT_1167984 [Trichoderma citrinoviride]PTB67595.1 hypothetical protein BBK36DRAFT_1167984 [Trichoderma citrinoviride]
MKFSTTSVLLAAALGVSAHPSGHAHKRAHNSAVEARGDFVMANKPADAPTTTSAGPVATTTAAAPASSSTGSATVKPFCSGNSKRATQAEIAYKGNVGAGTYGCNIMTIDESLIDEYQYTVLFKNAGADTTCFCWNKIGPDGGINGFFKGNQAITFDVPAGGSQPIAVDTNSQIGCACGPNGPPLTTIGQFAGTWFEGDFGNMSNGGWSGADASSLVAAAAGMTIPGLKVCGTGSTAGTCSIIYPGGKGDNAFTAGTEALDGLGLNIAPGKTSLVVTIDYQG